MNWICPYKVKTMNSISWINKLPFIIVIGLNFSTILLTLLACTLRKYHEVLDLIYWKQLLSISNIIIPITLLLLIPSIIYYGYIRKWKYLIWLLVIGFNPITIIWLITNI